MTATAPHLGYREAMRVDLPEIDAEGVRVEKFEISEAEAEFSRIRRLFDSHGRGMISAGTYTRLSVDGRLWMSDSTDEMVDHAHAFWEAQRRGGRVLINGLGLGMVLGAILRLDNVEHVDVVEKDERIARLIGQHYASDRCTIHVGDAYDIQWPTGTRWTVAWHDIWPTITSDNWSGMNRLHRRYGRRVDWQDSWARDTVRREINNDRRWGY